MASAPTRSSRFATFKFRALLAAIWAGQLLTVALLAAPNAFATLARPEAAAYVARLFQIDARISLALALLLAMIDQRLQRQSSPGRLRFGPTLILPLAALFFTVLGYEVLRPLMDEARGGPNFGLLHGLSMAAFAAKTVCVVLLAWFSSASSSSASAWRA